MSVWIAIAVYMGMALFVGRFLSLSSRGTVLYRSAAPAPAGVPAPERHEPTAPAPAPEEHSRSEEEVAV